MTLNDQLKTAARALYLVNTDAIVEQGRAAFRAIFAQSANPFKSDRDRKCWENGYKAEQQKWGDMLKRWRDLDRSERGNYA